LTLLDKLKQSKDILSLSKIVINFYKRNIVSKSKFKEFFGLLISTFKGLTLKEIGEISEIQTL